MGSIPIEGPKAALPDPGRAKRLADAKATSQEFEAVFIGEMTKLMIETRPENSLLDGGNAENIYQGMLSEQMGKAIAKNGGIGLAPHVFNEILKMQGDQ